MAGGGGNKKRYQHCNDSSGAILYLRALQGHSGCNLIDPTLQDNVVIQSNFFQYIHHIGCAINLHSIVNSGLTPGGQKLSKRQTVFFTSVDPTNKEYKDPDTIDLEAPRLARYKQKTWQKHQTRCIGSTSNSLKRKEVLSDTIERHHPLQHLSPSLLYFEGYQDGNWRNQKRKSKCVTPASSEDFL